MFYDESRFGRISGIAHCWCVKGIRPIVPALCVREYMYVFGAVDPVEGSSSFIIAPACNTDWTNTFFDVVSRQFPNDYIIMAGDNAGWHKSKGLNLPNNMELMYIPAYTPEMNPIEQVWDEIKEKDFKNHFFDSLKKVTSQLCKSFANVPNELIKSLCNRDWINAIF
jgi:putative transposase